MFREHNSRPGSKCARTPESHHIVEDAHSEAGNCADVVQKVSHLMLDELTADHIVLEYMRKLTSVQW